MNNEFLQKLTDIVVMNLENETFHTEDLARQMGMSHSSLHRKLKAISNQTISQFIRHIRLNKAKELIQKEDLTIAEISYRVGFGSPTYFNKCFHEYFGHAPGELRKEEQNHEIELPIAPVPQKSKRSDKLVILLICLLILIPAAIFLVDKLSMLKATNVDQKSIAVLPFKYMSGEIGKQYLADGMMDAILLNLARIKDLRVISRTSVEQYRNTEKTITQIGRELDVAYILEGSYQKDGAKIRLILQLLKTKNEGHAWSDKYDRNWEDVFLVQSEVSETIASELDAVITPDEKQLIRKYPTANLTAYDFYQKGIDELDNNADSISLGKARILFQKALKQDSTFSMAFTGLARINYSKYYRKTFFSKNFLDSVLILANKALAYDNQCAEAYYYRGAYYYERANPVEALKEIGNAIQFNPNFWKAYYIRSHILAEGLADYVGAINNMQEAVLRNRGKDLPRLMRNLGWNLIEYGFPDLGKQFCRQSLELDGDSSRYLLSLGWAEYCSGNFEKAYLLAKIVNKRDSTIVDELSLYATMTGRFEEAFSIDFKNIERLKKKGEIDLYASKGMGYYLWKMDRIPEAKYYFNQQIQYDLESIQLGRWNAVQRGAHFDLAEVYAFLGDKQKAYEYLDEVTKNHAFPRWSIILFKHDPLLDNLRQEPRFQLILKVVESKYQAEHERVRIWLMQQGLLSFTSR
ncbi:MAG TPA: helix-turn-helix domain-containing protein [Prolixibacteraceae bacterium]|jgi:TolB-like protein/AraC-like DNA-binding protein